MEHAIRNFAFDDQLVRVVMRGEDPWFVAADICRILHLRDASEAVEKLDDDEKHLHEGLNTPDSIRGNPNRYIVLKPAEAQQDA
jgi:prophage antirepressor-like protein